MSSGNNNNNGAGGNDNPLALSDGQLLQLTNEDVEDALDFDLDFDNLAEVMGDALPNIDLGDMGSLGTRSPSPSGSSSVLSKGSKRSRAEFDSESECDSYRDKMSKRMVSQTGFSPGQSGPGMNEEQQQRQRQEGNEESQQTKADPGSSTNTIHQDREREGRCPDCGVDTHRIVMNEDGFELQPLTIEGEVLNGQCLLCNPLKEGGSTPDKPPPAPAAKKGGRMDPGGSSSTAKKKGGSKGDPESEPELNGSFRNNKSMPSRGITSMGSGMNMSPSPHQQQRKSMSRNMRLSPPPSGNNLPLQFPPPERRGGDSGGRRTNKFSTPTPNQYHSKMALLKQAQLPRKHSGMQHAAMVFGNTNNRSGKNSRRQSSNTARSGSANNRRRPTPDRLQTHSSNASLSSVSCSEVERDGDDTYSKASQFSQNSNIGGGGLRKAMAMGMGMSCTETAPGGVSGNQQQHPGSMQQQQRSMSRPQSPHGPQTPRSQRRVLAEAPLSRSGTAQTPPSVPVNMNNNMSARMAQMTQNTPQSVPSNMKNMMSTRMGGGGGGGGGQVPSPQSMRVNMKMHDNSNMSGNNILSGSVPPAVRIAHSKLQSSIYHHHIYPLNDDTERAHVEKTLSYLECGSGDICDIIVAMRRFPFSLAIQRVSCEKLYAHCFDKEHASAIGLVGGIRTVIDSMEHHPDDAALQRGCAGVIKHLASASSYNLDMLDRMGAVAIVVATMERHPQNAPLLESCCWAIEAMARGQTAEIKMRVAKGGGIHAAMKAVENFPNNESLLRAAFHCLRRLGYNPTSYNANQQGGHPLQQQQGHQQSVQQRRGSSAQQQQQQGQQVPSFVSQRGGSGGNMPRGGGGMMMPNMSNMMGNNPMMGNSMGGNSMMGNNNPMMGNNNPMMGNNSPMMGNNNSMMGNNNPMMGNNNTMMGNPNNSMMGNPNNSMMGNNNNMMGNTGSGGSRRM